MEKYKKLRDEAIVKLGTLLENPIEDTEAGVHGALECVFRRGTAKDKATAAMIAGQWMWAHCEMTAHAEEMAQK